VSTHGVRVILIDDLNDLHLPMFDFTLDQVGFDVSDWSTQMLVDLNIGLRVNFFNISNSHWEPIVEPWDFGFNVTRSVEGYV
jgi:vacuolar protein sorting-associated protein 13A/C